MTRILIAEHNETTREYLAARLQRAGNHIASTDNNTDAWRLAQSERFDVLLVDIAMPKMDGFVLAQKALQENPTLQVVFITGFSAIAMDTEATPVYAPAPFTKRPFHLKDIAAHVCYLAERVYPASQQATDKIGSNIVYADFGQKKYAKVQQV